MKTYSGLKDIIDSFNDLLGTCNCWLFWRHKYGVESYIFLQLKHWGVYHACVIKDRELYRL